ncbi:MAG: RsmE family RNA methyltransferase [Chitinivibrionales bacterium]|nr:RsmE family RNA methyltransferase [Chitinivibrionales bacterium]
MAVRNPLPAAHGPRYTDLACPRMCILVRSHKLKGPTVDRPYHHLFYSTETHGGRLHLTADEARHATRVLRLSPGDELWATDGAGAVYHCRLADTSTEGAACEIIDITRHDRSPPCVDIYVGLPDRDAFEWLIDAATPLGVRRIVPIVCARSQHPWWRTKWDKLRDRFTRKMTVAVKQALHPFLPELAAPVELDKAVSLLRGEAVVADEQGIGLRELSRDICSADTLSAFVGPPGGFTSDELRLLHDYPAQAVRLSPNRLRTELAAVLLCGMLLAP